MRSLSLQWVLIVPFVLQVVGAVSLVGYLSFRNGQKAIDNLVNEVMDRNSALVNQHLDTYLAIPHQVNQITAHTIEMGLLDIHNLNQVNKFLWKFINIYDLTYLNFSLPSGEAAGVGRFDGITVTFDETRGKPPNNNKNYSTNEKGDRGKLNFISTWEPTRGPWYTEPVKAGKPIWTRIYTYYDPSYPPYVAAAAGRPVYDANHRLLVVIGAEIHLLKLSEFLRHLDVSRHGQTFILERNGMLVANSGETQPFTIIPKGNTKEIKRVQASESTDYLVQKITRKLEDQFHGLHSLDRDTDIKLNVQGEPYFVEAIPWKDAYGLDWLVVTAIPQHEFMAQINANTLLTFWLCLAALVVSSCIGVLTSRWIADPILRLSQASQLMTEGDLAQTVANSSIQEINTLTTSFNKMAQQLQESFTALETTNAVLEERVEARTHDLKETLIELQTTQTQMIQSEKMSSLGQLVAGVAHEINNPVNFIHGNISHLQEYVINLLKIVELYQKTYPNSTDEIQAAEAEADLEFLQSDLQKILSSMKLGTDRIREIVLSLRNFSRMDEAEFKVVDIHQGINSTLMILQHRLKAKAECPEIQVIKEYGAIPLVECFAGQLNQVFMNILVNAIDALEEGNNKRSYQEIKANPNQITIRTSVIDNEWVKIAIADNGPGMSEEVRQKICDPFFTTKPIGKGTGMGMSISYQIITARHHGKLECFSSLGKGTEFAIEIPIRQGSVSVKRSNFS